MRGVVRAYSRCKRARKPTPRRSVAGSVPGNDDTCQHIQCLILDTIRIACITLVDLLV